MPLLDDMDRRRETAARHKENSGRLAQAYASFESTGQGTLEYEERIDFNVIFVEMPYVCHAGVVDTQALKELLGYVALPQISGFVTEWDTDEKDLYRGCWVAARIDFPEWEAISLGVDVVVNHHFTFAGVAIKNIEPENDL